MPTGGQTGILFFVDGVRNRYRSPFPLDQEIASFGPPLDILQRRLQKIPGLDAMVLLLPDHPDFQPLRDQAAGSQISIETFDLAEVREKPWSITQERWQLERDRGFDTWVGSAFAAVVKKRRWQRVILLPLTNLLIDRDGLRLSLQLHQREGFDLTFSEDRLLGADWVIFEADLLLGLQAQHPDIMGTRGGLAWAVARPLYPFKTGAFHSPRVHPRLPVDLRLRTPRAKQVYQNHGGETFATPDFRYESWVLDSGWEETFTDFGPTWVELEPTNVCQGQCRYCPQPLLQRPKGRMAMPLFDRLTADLASIDDLQWVFSGLGEPFAHPDLAAMVDRLAHRHTSLVTSLSTLPPADFPWKSLDQVRLSVDAVEQELFDQLRPGCSWNALEIFLKEAGARKVADPEGEPDIGVTLVKHPGNDGQAMTFLNYWKQVCRPVFRNHFFRWPTDLPPERVQWFQILGYSRYLEFLSDPGRTQYTPLKRRCCQHALLRMQVLQDGTLARCRFDAEGRWAWSQATPETPILDLWRSEAAREFRRRHLRREFDAGHPCASCQDWYHL